MFDGTLYDHNLFGYDVDGIGDLDDDGVNDIVVGAWGDDGGPQRGEVWVLFLNEDRTVKTHQKISDTYGGFSGVLQDWDTFGYSVAGLGDLDGDGIEDVAVGGILGDDDVGSYKGGVWILFLNKDGTVKNHQKITDGQGGFDGLNDGDYFGRSLANIGDINDDGITDIAVGIRGDNAIDKDKGGLWILFLNKDGTVQDSNKIVDGVANFFPGFHEDDHFGEDIASLGDVNGDGVEDIAVLTKENTTGFHARLYIIFLDKSGGSSGWHFISDVGFCDGNCGFGIEYKFGTAVIGVGDEDRNGVNDLIVSVKNKKYSNTDTIAMVFLEEGGVLGEIQVISEQGYGLSGYWNLANDFAHALGAIGDMDGDGFTDIVIGHQGHDDGGSGRGAVWIFDFVDHLLEVN